MARKQQNGWGEEVEEVEESDGDGACAFCNQQLAGDMVCCDVCDKWAHVHCVNLTPLQAKSLKHFYCPICKDQEHERSAVNNRTIYLFPCTSLFISIITLETPKRPES